MAKRLSVPGLAALALLALPTAIVAAPLTRVLASDDRGITLRLDVPSWRLAPASAGFQRLEVSGFEASDVPGRPALAFASVLVALPPGAGASVRVESEEWQSLGEARLEVAGKPEFQGDDPRRLEPVRTPVAAIQDGAWPRASAEVGEPFSLRRQRMVAVQLRPFRWDAGTRTLTGTRSMVVRVQFTGRSTVAPALGARAEDRHWEPVLREALANYDQARSWRGVPTRAARSGPSLLAPSVAQPARVVAEGDYPEVRVKLDTTGVYEMTYEQLAPKGYPANIPISQVSVHRHEFVEGANPPFVAIELPIEVDDSDGNGFFNDVDRVLVYAQSWGERSRASYAQRRWGDAEMIYVTAVNGTGLRMATRPGWRNTPGLTPLASYPWTQRWEKNFNFYLFPPDTLTDQFQWTEIALYYFRPDTLRFETNHLDATQPATVSASWIGRGNGSHFSWAQFRKSGGSFVTVADSLFWFGSGAQTATVTVPGSSLGEGNVNTMAVWGKRSTAPPDPILNNSDNVGFNWIQATYWRRYRALNQYLSCNNAGASGEYQILATGFTYPPIVYDVTDSLNPVRLNIDPSHITQVGFDYQVEFQDSVAAGQLRRYVVYAQAKLVPAASLATVTRRQLTNRAGGDYLLVVPEALLPAVAPLVALRQSQGLDVVVAPFESVCDEFNGGRRSDFALKRLVRYAYDNWNAKFLLLVGDGSEDPQNFMKESTPDLIPVHQISGPVVIQFGYEIIPSDPWYVCMENCDLGGTNPVLQDLFVGRLPVQTLAQAQGVVAKLVAYEDLSGDQTWRQNILLCDDDAYSAETFFGGGGSQGNQYCYRPSEVVFRQLNETIERVIHDDAGLQQAVLDTFHLDTRLKGVACDPGSVDCQCKDQPTTQQITHSSITPDLLSKLNAGRMWWNFQGHANEFVLAHEDLYINRGTQDDKDLLMNDGKPFLFSAFSCHANAFARMGDRAPGRGPALGEEMAAMTAGGAIGSWASTGYEILPFSGTSHINVSWARAMFETPPNDPNLGQGRALVVLGETIALALARYVPTVIFNPNEKGVGLTYNLMGDPATRLSIGPPEAVVTANTVPVVDDQPIRLHTLGDTLRLEADLVSNVALTTIALQRTDAAGTVTIPAADYTLVPAFPDTSVSGGRRYHLTYHTTLAPESYTYTFLTQDRYGVSATFDATFQFLTQLLLNGSVLAENDPVAPAGAVSLRLFSPRPLNPLTDLILTVNGATQPFTPTAVPGDASGREWILAWTHPPYPIDQYEVRLDVTGGGTHTHHFRVLVGGTELQVLSPIAFPNPFDDAGTAFSFTLVSGSSVDILIRVFTTAGHLVYERDERSLAPGYHQLPWNGRDAEGDQIANGVYIYRMLATNGSSKTEHLGRLVKLRKPTVPIRPDPRAWLALAGLWLLISAPASAAAPTLRAIAVAEDERRFRPEIEQGLHASDAATRARAALAVGRLQDSTTVTALVPLASDTSPEVRREAVFALGQIGHRSAQPALAAGLDDRDPETVLRAIEALGKLGDKQSTRVVAARLSSVSPAHRAAAAMALWRLADSTALDPLLARHNDPDPEVRWRVIYAVEKIAAPDRVLPALTSHLDDPSPLVRAYTARTIGRQKSPRGVASLLQALGQRDVAVVVNAIRALQFIGDTTCARCGASVARLLSHSHPYVRVTAAGALGDAFAQAGNDAERAAIRDSLTARLSDSDAATRAAAARSLLAILGDDAPGQVRRVISVDHSLYARVGAMSGLRSPRVRQSWKGFLAQRLSPEQELLERMTAAEILGARAEPGSAELLRAGLQEDKPLVVAACAAALAEMEDTTSVPLLAAAYGAHTADADPDARLSIRDALRDLAGRAVADSVERAHPARDPARDPAPPARAPDFGTPPRVKGAILKTEKGSIEWEFYPREAPETVRNFVRLAKSLYFDGSVLHRVVPNFVIQDGDPTGTGSGGPGYTIRCEYNALRYAPGMVGMALSGKDTGGSQWFITHSPQPHLDGRYTIFAHVTKGMDVVQKLVQGDRLISVEIVE